jgi:PAS domain S-box-containing protein
MIIEGTDAKSSAKNSLIHILHVDDDRAILESSKTILTIENNFEIDSASNVAEAFKKLETNSYDAIISDYEMPCKDGLEFLRALRGQKNGIPFILFTGKGREDVAIQALNLGADYYVNKQGSPETVYGELSHHLIAAVERNRAKLQNSNDALALRSIQEAIVMSDAFYTVTSWNKIAEEILGVSSEEAIGRRVSELFKGLEIKPTLEELSHVVMDKGRFNGEITFRNRDGQVRDGALEIISIFTENGKFMGNIATCRDITERKKSEKLLAESESKYRVLVESSLQGILIVRPNPLRFCFANDAMARILGYSVEELLSLPPQGIIGLIHTAERTVFFNRLQRRFRGEKAELSLEFRAIRKDGSTVWLEGFSSKIEYLGQPAVQGEFLNIDERKRVQEAVKTSEEKYRELANSLPDIVFEADLGGNLTFLNERAFEKLGLSYEDFEKGLTIYQLIAPEDRERAKENVEKMFSGQIHDPIEYKAMRKDGSIFTVLVRASRRIVQNKVVGFRAIVMDITHFRETEERLIESEQKYRDIFESARDAIYVHDLKGKILSVNSIVEEYGFSKKDIIGHNMMEFIPKKYWPKLGVHLLQLERGRRVEGEIEVDTPLGRRSAEYRSNPIVRGNKTVVVHSVLRDVTDRRKYEEAMLESQQKFKALFAANPEAAAFMDIDYRVVEANPQFSLLFGYSFDEIKGKVLTDLIVPEEAKEESSSFRKKVHSEPAELFAYRKRKDGSQIPLFLSGGPVFIRDHVIGAVVVYKDISDIITVQEALSKALATSELLNEKLSIVGGFVRHDVRNKLCAINGSVYLLKKNIGDNHTGQQYLDQIQRSSDNVVRILDFAKTFESLGNEKLVPLDVGSTVDQAASLFSDLRGVKIVNECTGFYVVADSMLTTIFHNLIDNSMKYGEKLTQIRVSGVDNADGSRSITYEDDGVGIDAATKGRLFEKGVGKGTGLGLYLIRKATDVYGWKISEIGVEGCGAKFVMTIPKISDNGKTNHQNQR